MFYSVREKWIVSMANKTNKIIPTAINLHQKSRVLELIFSDGKNFELPCEYLRVYSPSAEVKAAREPVHGKSEVNISRIEPKGNYAVRLYFDDGHSTGVYSWDTLHRLGEMFEQKWAEYLQRLSEHGLDRGQSKSNGERSIQLLYFMQLVDIAGEEIESLTLPASVTTVAELLAWLRERGAGWMEHFDDTRVQVTVNKQFADTTTLIEQGDEVAIVPKMRD